jgi:thiamine biosynthesis lipoprotein
MSAHEFRAMGTTVVVGGGTPRDNRAIERLYRERDLVFSRFIPGSELNRVNESTGRLVPVSHLFADTLRVALSAAAETSGMVVPTAGAALEAAGYTRDFSLLAPDSEPPAEPEPADAGSVELLGRLVRVRLGVKLDLNGVVKSLAVDDALALLSGDGFVSAGGDLAARGELTVALPDGDAVALRRGALATSGSVERKWLRAGRVQHHLIDPRTGRPATTPWAQVTACGATCLAADVAAKAGFLLGDDGPGWLDARGVPARFLEPNGRAIVNRTWSDTMREALACP